MEYYGSMWRTNTFARKNGLLNMLPSNIQMIHGPGCPVCVTPISLIDKAVHLAVEKK